MRDILGKKNFNLVYKWPDIEAKKIVFMVTRGRERPTGGGKVYLFWLLLFYH